MSFYALATLPLINRLPTSVKQVWYADDATAIGTISDLRTWWESLACLGPSYGYFPNAAKTWLLTKPDYLTQAKSVFADTKVNITCDGRPHLGAALGTPAYIDEFVKDKVDNWCAELDKLSSIAKTQPHAAYAAYTHGMTSKWTYLARTIPDISHHYQRLERIIRTSLIPSLMNGQPPNDQLRNLLGLPARLGGIGVPNPAMMTDFEFAASLQITEPLKRLVLAQEPTYTYEAMAEQMSAISEIRKKRRKNASQMAEELSQSLPPNLQRAIDLAKEKGASSWLTTLPIKEFGFCLHKGAFSDALALRYGLPLSRLPSHCACGRLFTVEHALSCSRGGFPIIRHNEVRDLTASLLTEVCHDVRVEPDLQPVTGEMMTGSTSNTNDGARLDIAVNGFWVGDLKKPTWMSECSTLMPRPTGTPALPSVTESMNRKRKGLMTNAFVKLSMPVLHDWSSQPLEA